jgi:hypothetical protein
MGSTTSERPLNFTTVEIKTALGRFEAKGRKVWSYDTFSCHIDLFEMLVDIVVLHKTRPGSGSPDEETLGQTTLIMRQLRDWQPPESSSGPREHLLEAWRFGVMAYLLRLFPSEQYSVKAQDLAKQALGQARLTSPTSTWGYSTLWPIFQVGVTLKDEDVEEKDQIRSRLRVALETVGCHHFSNALETLEHVWENGSVYKSSSMTTFGRTIMLA